MNSEKPNRITTGLFLPITYILFSFIGTALFLYFYIFQEPSLFSVKRFLFSFACSALLIGIIFGLLIIRKKFVWAFEQINFPLLFLQTFLLTCYFIFFIPKPVNHLYSKSLALHAEFQSESIHQQPLELLWLNNGLRDISYSDIQYTGGTVVENTGLYLTYNEQGRANFTWHGPVWEQLTIVARSNEPFTAVYQINNETYTFHYTPQKNQDFRMQIPISSVLIQTLAALTVHLSSFFFFSILLFSIQILLMSVKPTNKKVSIKQSMWMLVLALPLLGILLYLIRIGLYNRLYSDDYCYLVMVRDDGYFPAIHFALRKFNGRFMSHLTDFFLFIWQEALMPYGMLFSVTLLGGSLLFLFHQLIDVRNKLHKFTISFILSAVIILTTFFLAPFIYESAFWALHALIVCGGFTLFNTAMGIVLRVSQKARTNKQLFRAAGGLLIIGFLSCGFHENTGILVLLTTGTTWLLVTVFYRKQPFFNNAGKLLFFYMLGSLIGFLTIVFMPGEQGRLSIMNVSYALDQTLLSTYRLTLVKLDVIFKAFHQWGFIILITTGLFAFFMGKMVAVPEVFSRIDIKHRSMASLLFLFPFVLFVISFVPSTFINNYYPNRTLIVPIYFFVLTFFFISFFTGLQQKNKANHVVSPVWSIVLGLILIVAYIAHFIPVGTQFAKFANEWDSRDREIRSNASLGLAEMNVDPYEHSFGIDISTTNNLFLTQCYDEYYGIHVIPPE